MKIATVCVFHKDPQHLFFKSSSMMNSSFENDFVEKTLLRLCLSSRPSGQSLATNAEQYRINLGAARTAGMGLALVSNLILASHCQLTPQQHLEIGARFSVATGVYFIPYILLQIPGNLVIRKFGPRNYLTFVRLAGVRSHIIGPSASGDYRSDCSRLALFYLMALTIGGFGPILAYVLNLLDGKRIIEGAVALFLGVTAFFLLPDFPELNTFLTAEQTAFVLQRVKDDRGDSVPEQLTFREALHHLGWA
ncbi:hypothetical protein B0H13DRAFT_1870631 [Mycena leptocephala]|nr:hypothetical protein B0H13DRAFT_1870631 [Mycena leptocephala]